MKTKPKPTLQTSLNDLASVFPKLAGILIDARLDSVYKDILVAYQQSGAQAACELAKERGVLNPRNELVLNLKFDTTDTDSLKSDIEACGIKITAASENLVDIAIPLELFQKSIDLENPAGLIVDITRLKHILRIRLPIPAIEDVDLVKNEPLLILEPRVRR